MLQVCDELMCCMGCVAGYEPHSALPTALPLVFCEHSELAPPALRSVKTLATSAVRIVPPCMRCLSAVPMYACCKAAAAKHVLPRCP